MTDKLDTLKSYVADHVTWFGQSAVRLSPRSGTVVFIDPFHVPASAGPVGLILITHPHGDHYDRKAVAGLRVGEVPVVGPASMEGDGLRRISIGETAVIQGIKVSAVAAYNVAKRFHSRSKRWVGYLLELDGLKIYHAGDTDEIPEMAGLSPDIAFLPIGGLVTMNPAQAARALDAMGGSLAIPIHFGAILGGKRAGDTFSGLLGERAMVLTAKRS